MVWCSKGTNTSPNRWWHSQLTLDIMANFRHDRTITSGANYENCHQNDYSSSLGNQWRHSLHTYIHYTPDNGQYPLIRYVEDLANRDIKETTKP